MQFTLEIGKKGLRVRREILNASGFQREEALDVHGKEQPIVIMKKEMTAMDRRPAARPQSLDRKPF